VGGGLCKFDPNTEKFTRYRYDPNDPHSLGNEYISEIFQDRSGGIWIGGWGGGLTKLIQGEPTKFIQYKHDPDDPSSISHNAISKIYQDHSGTLWICTLGGGLNKLIPPDSETFRDEEKPDYTFIQFRKIDGLPSDIICGILEDDQHNFWISTNNGLVKFNPQTEKFITFDVRDGLGSNQFNIGACMKSRNGELYFGSLNGFTVVNPGEIVINTSLPSIVISDFKILNRPVSIGPDAPLQKHINEAENIYLSYKQNVFSFEFSALDYNQPIKNQYAYKLEGFDGDWIYTDAGKRFATYTNLNPGEYIFKVKGSNNDGAWNEEGTQVKISISPAFWSTWWFRILFFIAVFALAYGLYRGKLKNVKLKTELRAAHDAQMSIMPQADPQIENFDISGICLPANEVGGDFFDYFWLNTEKTKFGIVIGDVSGKAMKSAMTAVMTNGMVYLKATEINSVGAIMTHVNRSMYFKTDKSMFTALCIVALDLQKNELIFSNAGLNEPLLKSAQVVEYITSKGPKFPLGTVRETVYQENKVRLKPGDILILFTDGVPEAQNSSREFFGYEALKILFERVETSHLSAREIKDSIIAEIMNYAGRTPQHDDMTVIVVKAK
jgi:serine phosphatase RsbU (regulator of sigma subunit)